MAKKKVSEETQRLLKSVYDDCVKEDTAVRERQIREWRRLKLLWEGFSRIWFSEVAHDWRILDQTADEDSDQSYYDKPINVFKAYLESIIAALSITVPPVKCFPDDADNPLDLATAKAGDKIAQLIYRHNDVTLLWLHALFISVTEGMTACYNYPVTDNAYGTYDEKEYEDVEEEHELTSCSICGANLDDKVIPQLSQEEQQPNINPNQPVPAINPMGMQQPAQPMMTSNNPNAGMIGENSNPNQPLGGGQENLANRIPNLENQERDEFGPDNEDAELHAAINAGKELCPACMMQMDPEIKREKFIVTRLVGITTLPKSRICLEVYGGLYVKIPNYAKKQKDCPYLILSYENDYSMCVEKYEHLGSKKDKLLKRIKSGNQAGSYNQYDQWGRLSPQYQGEYPINVVTVNNAWLRPAKFNILKEEDAKKLKKEFPDGAKVVFVNDEFAEACNESLDDCWTLSENPLAEFLHFEPVGQGLMSIQEITNDLVSLVLQTIEHGIGQTFADPAVLNFKAYEQTEVLPGGVFPATPKSGKSLQEGFHELHTATLSAEVLPFYNNIQTMGQLVSGATPSIFGGQLQGVGGETASGYSMSRAQAMQRLQNQWKVYTTWWKTIFGKVVPMYIKEVKDDERDVQRDDDGNFVNVLIRKAELEGKIGKVELEANENIPLTWSQKKDIIEKLMQNANPEVMKIINAPENIGQIHEYLGLVDFYVPDEDSVIKQYDEIKLLLNSEPIETGDPMMPEMPSVEIDPLYDRHEVEFEIVRKWATSEAGRQTKTDNPVGYKNVLLHGNLHFQQVQQQVQAQAQQQMMSQSGKGATPGEKSKETNQEAPVMGNQNVETVQ
jgi:hypothetical protein